VISILRGGKALYILTIAMIISVWDQRTIVTRVNIAVQAKKVPFLAAMLLFVRPCGSCSASSCGGVSNYPSINIMDRLVAGDG